MEYVVRVIMIEDGSTKYYTGKNVMRDGKLVETYGALKHAIIYDNKGHASWDADFISAMESDVAYAEVIPKYKAESRWYRFDTKEPNQLQRFLSIACENTREGGPTYNSAKILFEEIDIELDERNAG